MSQYICGAQVPLGTATCGLFTPHEGPHRIIAGDYPAGLPLTEWDDE